MKSDYSIYHVTMAIPVAVHRWFATGAGWVVHEDLKPYTSKIIALTADFLHANIEYDSAFDFNGGLLVCIRCPEVEHLNKKAATRRPSVAVCAWLPNSILTRFIDHDDISELVMESARLHTLPTNKYDQRNLVLSVTVSNDLLKPIDWLTTVGHVPELLIREDLVRLVQHQQDHERTHRQELESLILKLAPNDPPAPTQEPLRWIISLIVRVLFGMVRVVDWILCLPVLGLQYLANLRNVSARVPTHSSDRVETHEEVDRYCGRQEN